MLLTTLRRSSPRLLTFTILRSSTIPRHYTTTTIASKEAPPQPLIITHNFPAPHTGTIHLLFLNDPSSRNSLSVALLSQLHGITKTLHTHPTARALVISSSCPTLSFCSGANLKERLNFTPQQTASFLTNLREAFSLLSSLPIPTVTCINGPALGGGLELALSTDFRVVGPRAKLGLPETRLGIIPGAGGTYRLPRLIGQHRAMDLILSGRQINFEEAHMIGLATRKVYEDPVEGLPRDISELAVVEGVIPDAITDAAFLGGVKLANEILMGSPVAVNVAKKVVALADERAENLGYEIVVKTKDRDEALKAFREKRKPKFVGK